MITVRKANKVLRIDENNKENYLARGYDVVNEKGDKHTAYGGFGKKDRREFHGLRAGIAAVFPPHTRQSTVYVNTIA